MYKNTMITDLLIEELLKFQILEVFPFESARKRMGIIIRNQDTNLIEWVNVLG